MLFHLILTMSVWLFMCRVFYPWAIFSMVLAICMHVCTIEDAGVWSGRRLLLVARGGGDSPGGIARLEHKPGV